MAAAKDTKVIGYFAYASSSEVVCDGDACVIAGSEVDLRRYLAELPAGEGTKYTLKKTCFELNEKIHEFHNGISRTLYGRYVGMDPKIGVAHAIKNDVLKRAEIDDEILALVSGMLEALSSPNFK